MTPTPNPKDVENWAAFHGWHSDQFVIMFLGFMRMRLGALADIKDPAVLLDCWREFKQQMGKIDANTEPH